MHWSCETGHEHGREYSGFLRTDNRLRKTGENAGPRSFGGGATRSTIVPGHPVLRTGSQGRGVSLEFGQVVERIGAAELAGIDQTHEGIADEGTVFGLVEHGVLAMENGLLQGPFADVVVQRSPGLVKEERQLFQCRSM